MPDENHYDEHRSDPSRGYKSEHTPAPGDRNFIGPVQPSNPLQEGPHDYVKSRTKEEREAQRQARTTERLEKTTRGYNGSVVKGNVHTIDPLQTGGRGGDDNLSRHQFVLCENGVAQIWNVVADFIEDVT